MESKVIERPNGSRRVVQSTVGESMTEQHHANEVNINSIVARYQKTGVLPERAGNPRFGDFSGVSDYFGAVEAVRRADEAFMSLPPDVRRRFGNDPGALLEFLGDEANRAEAEKLGLLEAREVASQGNGEPVGVPAGKAGDGKVAQ